MSAGTVSLVSRNFDIYSPDFKQGGGQSSTTKRQLIADDEIDDGLEDDILNFLKKKEPGKSQMIDSEQRVKNKANDQLKAFDAAMKRKK